MKLSIFLLPVFLFVLPFTSYAGSPFLALLPETASFESTFDALSSAAEKKPNLDTIQKIIDLSNSSEAMPTILEWPRSSGHLLPTQKAFRSLIAQTYLRSSAKDQNSFSI